MKKIRLMPFLALFCFLIASPKVLAYNATVYYGDSRDIGVRYRAKAGVGAGTVYKSKDFTIDYGGKTYPAFCLDPDLSGPKQVTCSPYEGDPGLVWLLQQLNGASSDLQLLTFRMYGVYTDMMKTENNEHKVQTPAKTAITAFLQIKDGNTDVMKERGTSNPYDLLFGNTALIDQAFNLAYQARSMNGGALEETTTGSINVGQKQVNGLNATYPLTSGAEIKPEFIDFKCENCTILNKQWNGTTGSVTVAANECDKEYNLIIVYKSSTTNTYTCSSNSTSKQSNSKKVQTFFMIADGSEGEVEVPYPDKLACDGEDCCNEDPIKPGWIGGNVNNCCEDGGNSEAHEYDLDKLFCRDKDLQVDYYLPKCKTDYYVQKDTNLNEKYCKMYCTERVSVEIPGPITATSGRYFQLTTTSKGTKSPYIEGFKRCRIRVQYDIWEKDYNEVVKKEIENYNNYQYNETQHLIYENGASHPETKSGSIELKVSCHTETSYACDKDGDGKKDETCYKTTCEREKSTSYPYNYTKYRFDITEKRYHRVKLKDELVSNYTAYELTYRDSPNVTHSKYSTWNLEEHISAANSALDSLASSCGCATIDTKTREKMPDEGAGYPNENVPERRDYWDGQAKASNNAYNGAAREAKQLEEDIDRCDNYFTKYEGANAEENYAFNTSMSFSYTQVYMDNDRGLQMDEQYIQFEDEPGCVITGPTLGPDGADKLAGKRYSSIYKTGFEKMTDFKETTLKYQEDRFGFRGYQDEPYDADKLFTHDAKYRAECSWNEGENIYYTLSPNGLVSEGTDFINFTEHGQEYRLHLSTLDGKYETHWQLVGLGSTDKTSGKGKFDDFFMSQGQTCANESPSETSMLTCKIHVEYEIVLTGYCNGSNGSDTTVNVEDCDPYKEGYNLFSFKVVDPSNIFPNGYSTSAGDVGYNWSSTEIGKQIKNEIESRGKSDKTYSQEFLTYSFVLSPTDMGHIKNYNAQANSEGGYSDFNLECNCSGGSCKNCKSVFLNELANGNVNYDGTSHSVTGWSNKQTNLDGIRRKYGW